MYQKERSQRNYFSKERRELQKERRATNLIQPIKRQASFKGYEKIKNFHIRFLKRLKPTFEQLNLLGI